MLFLLSDLRAARSTIGRFYYVIPKLLFPVIELAPIPFLLALPLTTPLVRLGLRLAKEEDLGLLPRVAEVFAELTKI